MWSKEGKEKILDAANRGRERISKEAAERYYENPNICLTCGKIIELNGQRPSIVKQKKFCDKSCAAKYNNVKFPKRISTKSVCLNCGNIIKYNTKFCCHKCSTDYKHNQTIKRFYNGELTDIGVIRSILKEIKNHKCEICNNTQWNDNPIPLEVDHIDGNHENNFPNNLRLICPNCHALTDTYKYKNKGNGRAFRRERYAQGKSY